MKLRAIEILLDDDREYYEPGDTLSGQFLVVPDEAAPLKAVEVSVLWRTEGKGDEDIGVHSFERFEAHNGGNELVRPMKFRTTLPKSPLSYAGQIVKIVWCVRVRAFPKRGADFAFEESFRLGNVMPSTAVESE